MYKCESFDCLHSICDHANKYNLKIVHIDEIISSFSIIYYVIFEEK